MTTESPPSDPHPNLQIQLLDLKTEKRVSELLDEASVTCRRMLEHHLLWQEFHTAHHTLPETSPLQGPEKLIQLNQRQSFN